MVKRFEQKVAIITGAGSGLGRSAAVKLAMEGAKLSLVDLNIGGLKETQDFILKTNPEAELLLLSADVSNEEEVCEYVDDTLRHFGNIHGFYNNAGISENLSVIDQYNSTVFSKVVDVNLYGVFYGLKYVLPIMKKQKQGSIVNTASIAGIRGIANRAGYVATKHGVVGLTKTAAIEYAQYGININAIAPGRILTNMVINSFKERNPENWEASATDAAKDIPAKRLGTPEEVASLVAFLLSEESQYINGTVISIDGGLSSKFD
jgi:NAD(P)-dependent dehydrogenase (short-subunit alcohol dehydrogenase family)